MLPLHTIVRPPETATDTSHYDRKPNMLQQHATGAWNASNPRGLYATIMELGPPPQKKNYATIMELGPPPPKKKTKHHDLGSNSRTVV